ncbi:hypothetical protein JTE90_029328 [Oedothorax gibbosus]|uniref:Uncharacterized protein n=1 Tax=Oedothorax gibbosus TaxID=931172 RepID=A0AAV6UJD7_9ARAC|nr:hypothetical protein JTE90_029328 [Oedothorax gibbosus]
MYLETTVTCKPLLAMGARVGALSRVDEEMPIEIPLMIRGVGALRALVSPVGGEMPLFVRLHDIGRGKEGAAHIARVSSDFLCKNSKHGKELLWD